MDTDIKIALAGGVLFVILVLGGMGIAFNYYKTTTIKFISAGFHQEQLIGNQGVYWVK
jgi:hypothetical protein